MKIYNVGIVGFGWAAGAHLKSYTELPNFKPVAIMSRRKLDSAQIKTDYGVDVTIYNDYDKFLDDKKIDIVDICTPHPLHAEQAIKAANAKKNIIIEKPIALNFREACRMLDAVEKNGVMTVVCFEVRIFPISKAMKSIINEGLLGDIYYAECDYFHGIGPWYKQFEWNVKKDMGGSSLLTAGCHSLDILIYLVNSKVEEVFSYSTRNPHEIYKPYEYDTTSVTLLKFNNGALGKVASVTDCMQPYFFNMNIVGSHGTIKNDLFFSKKIDGLKGWTKLDVQLVDSGDVAHHPYKDIFNHFAECLDSGKESPILSLTRAFETHGVIFAADKSAETGKPVSLNEFKR